MSKIVLKISGEYLKDNEDNVSKIKLEKINEIIKLLQNNGHSIAIVIGGGNFFRGRSHPDMDKVTADSIGMLGTVMNALYVKDTLLKDNIKCIVSTPFSFPNLLDNYEEDELINEFNSGSVIVFGGGVGKSGYSTDSGVVLACNILNCDLIIKLTNVDGVYDSDPNINSNAKKYEYITYQEVLDNNLGIMDAYAIQNCMDNKTKILVMNINDYSNLLDFFDGKRVGTLIGE